LKILITGCTARQTLLVLSDRVRKIVNMPRIIYDILARHADVTWREVVPGEDLSEYDLVLVWMLNLSSRTAHFWPGAVWAIYSRPDALMATDDWQIGSMVNSVAGMLEREDKMFILGPSNIDKAMEYKQQLRVVLERLVAEWPTMLVPLFSWGDVKTISAKWPSLKNLVAIDYSPGIERCNVPIVKPEDRQRVWVLASLTNQVPWARKLHCIWPLACYGNKHLSVLQVDQSAKVKFIPESEIVKVYAHSWGILASRYPEAIAGWWRIRVNHAAQTGAVLYTDPQESKLMGPAYQLSIKDIESKSAQELKLLSLQQQNWLAENVWSYKQLEKTVLKTAADNAR
jgi:hypothetical protein